MERALVESEVDVKREVPRAFELLRSDELGQWSEDLATNDNGIP